MACGVHSHCVLRFPFVVVLAISFSSSLACTANVSTEEDGVSEEELAKAPMANFKKVRSGLYRGGHPDAAGIAYLKKIGVKTIVDLEIGDFIEATPWSISDELDAASAAGITVLRYPMSAFEPALSRRFDDAMSSILAVLADKSRAPIYVHCKHGQDRTGLVVGLERVELEGWTPAKAHAEMVTIGFHTAFVGLEEYFENRTGWENR